MELDRGSSAKKHFGQGLFLSIDLGNEIGGNYCERRRKIGDDCHI